MDTNDSRELLELVEKAVRYLPEREQLIIALHFREEISIIDIAEVLGTTEAEIEQQLSKALDPLRRIGDAWKNGL